MHKEKSGSNIFIKKKTTAVKRIGVDNDINEKLGLIYHVKKFFCFKISKYIISIKWVIKIENKFKKL